MDCENLCKDISNINIVFTDDVSIKSLNLLYRKKDKPTDVLSFSYIENENGQEYPENTILGELVISYQTAYVQSKRYKQTFSNEILRLLVHGIHHLLGFEHEKVSSNIAQKMRRSERKIYKNILLNKFILGIYNE